MGIRHHPIEFFYNLSFSAKSWENPTSIDRKEQNKKMPLVGIEPITTNYRKTLIGGLPCYSLNLQMCETGDSIDLDARDFSVVIQRKSPNVLHPMIFDIYFHIYFFIHAVLLKMETANIWEYNCDNIAKLTKFVRL